MPTLDEFLDQVRRDKSSHVFHAHLFCNVHCCHIVPAVENDVFVSRLAETLYEIRSTATIYRLLWNEQRLLGLSREIGGRTVYPALDYIRDNRSLRVLSLGGRLDFDDGVPPPISIQTAIASAISENQSVTELSMQASDKPGSFHLLHEIFGHLAGRDKCTLEKVHIQTYGDSALLTDPTKGFSLYFQSLVSREKSLNNFELESRTVDVVTLNFLLETHIGGVDSIELSRCDFTVEACRRFAQLMRQNPGATRTVDVSIIYAVPPRGRVDRYEYLSRDFPRTSIGAFLIPSGGRIALRELTIPLGTSRHLPILAYYLPKSKYIRELNITLLEDRRSEDDDNCNVPPKHFQGSPRKLLLKGIHRNASLQSVSFQTAYNSNFFTPAQERKIAARMTRNEELPKILKEHANVYNPTASNRFPTLFLAASAMDMTALNNVRNGIELIGVDEDGSLTLGPAL